MSLINTQVQPFKVQAYQNGKFIEVTEQSLKGQWSAFDLHACRVHLQLPDRSRRRWPTTTPNSRRWKSSVYIVTTDTHFAHKVWHETSPAVGKVEVPAGRRPDAQADRACSACTSKKKAWRCAAPS